MSNVEKTAFKKRTPTKQLTEAEKAAKADEIANRAENGSIAIPQNDSIAVLQNDSIAKKSRKPTTTLYCSKALHHELKQLALTESLKGSKVSVNDLLLEGINLLLSKYGKNINDYVD